MRCKESVRVWCSWGLINSNIVDFPSSVIKIRRVCNSLGTSTRASRRTKHISSPIPAKCRINGQDMVREMRANIACVIVESEDWFTPGRWVGCLVGDIAGNIIAREEPDLDSATGPLMGEDTTTLFVETCAIRAWIAVQEITTSVIRTGWGTI